LPHPDALPDDASHRRDQSRLPSPPLAVARGGGKSGGAIASFALRRRSPPSSFSLADGLRSALWSQRGGLGQAVYGLLLVLFIIFLPKGILGSVMEMLKSPRKSALMKSFGIVTKKSS